MSEGHCYAMNRSPTIVRERQVTSPRGNCRHFLRRGLALLLWSLQIDPSSPKEAKSELDAQDVGGRWGPHYSSFPSLKVRGSTATPDVLRVYFIFSP